MSKGVGIKEVRDTRERGEPFKDFKYEKLSWHSSLEDLAG